MHRAAAASGGKFALTLIQAAQQQVQKGEIVAQRKPPPQPMQRVDAAAQPAVGGAVARLRLRGEGGVVRDHISKHGSTLFDELGAAAGAGDLDAATAPGHPELLAALGAAVVVVELAVGPLIFQTTELAVHPILQGVVAVVLLRALGDVAAQGSVIAEDQQHQTQPGEQADAGEQGDEQHHDGGDAQSLIQPIGAVAADHELTEFFSHTIKSFSLSKQRLSAAVVFLVFSIPVIHDKTLNRLQIYHERDRILLPAADGQIGFGVQRALHAAVQHGPPGLAGGGQIGAAHAAPQRYDGRPQDLHGALGAQLHGLAAVGQQVAVLVDGAQADSGTVPGGAVGQDGVVHHAFQPDALHRLPHHGAHRPTVPDGLKAVFGGRAAQHADVLVVHPQHIVPAQPQREHPCPGQGRRLHGVPAQLVQDGSYLQGRSMVHPLILFQQGAHKVVDLNGWVRQRRKPAAPVGGKFGHEVIAAVQTHALGVGEHPAGPRYPARQVPQCHGGRDFQHDVRRSAGRFLAGVHGGGEFRVAEQIHHAVVADAVAAAEFPVGVVVGQAPAKAAGHALLGNGIVEHGGKMQGLHQPVGLIVKGLGREVLPAELADEVALAGIGSHRGAGFAGGTAPAVRVIVVGVNILQQLALAVVPRACRGAGGVQPVDGLVGALVKGFIIGAAVDPCTPQKHTGMVAALAHHLPAVLQGLRLPGFVADVLPAGHFGEHQQAQLVAGIQEGRALGVVAGAHGIAAQVLFDELGIQPLQAVRHGVALIGVALVPVDAPQHHPLAVQVQASGH